MRLQELQLRHLIYFSNSPVGKAVWWHLGLGTFVSTQGWISACVRNYLRRLCPLGFLMSVTHSLSLEFSSSRCSHKTSLPPLVFSPSYGRIKCEKNSKSKFLNQAWSKDTQMCVYAQTHASMYMTYQFPISKHYILSSKYCTAYWSFIWKIHFVIRTIFCSTLVMEKGLEVGPNLKNPKALLKQDSYRE